MLAYCLGGGNVDLLEKPVYNYIKKNHGVITFRDIEEHNFSYQQLNQLVSKGKVESIERGIYHLPETYIDDFFSLQYRFPKGIYSLDSALWLHGLSLTVPFEPVINILASVTPTFSIKEYISFITLLLPIIFDGLDVEVLEFDLLFVLSFFVEDLISF